jgi:elongation factor P
MTERWSSRASVNGCGDRFTKIMLAKEIKTGTVVVFEGNPVIVEGLSVQSPSARGAATLYKFRGRNVVTRNKIDFVLKGTESLDEADFVKRPVQLMYTDATQIYLMDQDSYQQYELPLEDATEQMQYVTEGLEGIKALIYNDECVGIDIPSTIELTIKQCDPSVKGNSATSRSKPAVLETGLQVQVPEFIKEGERIKVDSRTGEFLSRA